MSTEPSDGRTIGSSCALPDRLAARLALALVLVACLALAGCPRKAEPPPEAGTGSNTPIQIKTAPVMPPGFEGAFMIPDADVDQHGNPAMRMTIICPPCWPRELWLKEPRIEFVLIPAGEFDMESPDAEVGRQPTEGPVHRVTFAKPFYMGKYEVTQGQWEAVMGSNPSNLENACRDAPVDSVSWNDCLEFIGKLNALVGAGLRPAPTFRLPSEAEWEYACRAGTRTPVGSGDADRSIDLFLRYDASERTTEPAGKKKPNAWGLYDMNGNVREWCADVYAEYHSDTPVDGSARLEGGPEFHGVIRNGSWPSKESGRRSAQRLGFAPSDRHRDFGFRLAASPRPQ